MGDARAGRAGSGAAGSQPGGIFTVSPEPLTEAGRAFGSNAPARTIPASALATTAPTPGTQTWRCLRTRRAAVSIAAVRGPPARLRSERSVWIRAGCARRAATAPRAAARPAAGSTTRRNSVQTTWAPRRLVPAATFAAVLTIGAARPAKASTADLPRRTAPAASARRAAIPATRRRAAARRSTATRCAGRDAARGDDGGSSPGRGCVPAWSGGGAGWPFLDGAPVGPCPFRIGDAASELGDRCGRPFGLG